MKEELNQRQKLVDDLTATKDSLSVCYDGMSIYELKAALNDRDILISCLKQIVDADGLILAEISRANDDLVNNQTIIKEQMQTITDLSTDIAYNATVIEEKYLQSLKPSLN